MYSRIVIPTDGSKNAREGVKVGLDMATKLELPVMAIFVVDKSQLSTVQHASLKQSLKEGLLQDGKEAMKGIREKARNKDVKLEEMIITGAPHDMIIKHTNEKDLIIMCTHGQGNLRKLFMGSVTSRVLGHAKAGVLVVRPK